MGFGITPLLGDRRGFMPPQLKTNKNKLLVNVNAMKVIKGLIALVRMFWDYGKCKISFILYQ